MRWKGDAGAVKAQGEVSGRSLGVGLKEMIYGDFTFSFYGTAFTFRRRDDPERGKEWDGEASICCYAAYYADNGKERNDQPRNEIMEITAIITVEVQGQRKAVKTVIYSSSNEMESDVVLLPVLMSCPSTSLIAYKFNLVRKSRF